MPRGPAARLSDPVTHPAPGKLMPGPGSPNVLIGNKPAWRGVTAAAAAAIQAAKKTSDTTIQVAEAATLAAAGTPGAPAAKAAEETTKATAATSMASMIAGAAGGADIHACTTPLPIPPHGPGVVIDGSTTVFINSLAACRQGDTVLEPVGPPDPILLGLPTVIIGDQPGSTIKLVGTPAEIAQMQALLDQLRQTPAGRQLLRDIDNAKSPVTMQMNQAQAHAGGGGVTSWSGAAGANDSNGTGTPATVTLDPTLNDNSLFVFDKAGHKITDPPDVVAAHELTHALNVANGTNATDSPGMEKQAINGENQIRAQRTPPLPARDPDNHGGGYNPPPAPPPAPAPPPGP